MDDLMSVPDELDARESALLERFADLQGPSLEAEERMLAAIEAAIEAESEPADGSAREASPQPAPHRGEDGSRTWTSVAIAVTAFAAGALLTCGLQGEALRALEHGQAPSVSPMLADDDVESQEVPQSGGSSECEPKVIEKKIYVPVPATAESAEEPSAPRDEDPEPAPADGVPSGSSAVFGAVQDHDQPSAPARRSASSSSTVVSAAWVPSRTSSSSKSSRGGPGSTPRSRRGTGIGGGSSGWSPTSGTPTPGGPGGSAAPRTPAGPEPGSDPGQPAPSDNKPPQPQPDPPSADPESPPPPGPDDPPNTPRDPDDPPGPEDPPEDEPSQEDESPDEDWFEECDLQFEACIEHSMLVCETDPEFCGEISDACFYEHEACIFQDPEPAPQDWECEEQNIACFEAADMVCAEDPVHCEEFYLGCDHEFEACMGHIPPPPSEIPSDEDDPPFEE